MVLLEREPQLAILDSALDEVRRGSGRVALVSGEAGIGKTALVEHFTSRHKDSARVLWGASDSLFTPRPLGPLYDMSAQARLELPELLAPEINLGRLFASLLVEFKQRLTIAVFEDVHWADEATLDLLRYLGRRISQTRLLLVATYTDDALSLRHPLRSVLGDISAASVNHRIQLQPLSSNAVAVLAKGRIPDPDTLQRLTGGNPFFISEILASPTRGIPASIRDVVLARTAQLSLSGWAVLQAAAVIGIRCEPWLLSSVTGAENSAVEESLAAGLLILAEDSLSFRHGLTRQTILDLVPPQRKIVLHRLVLDALAASPTTRNDLVRLAHHAAATGDHAAVLQFAPKAAAQAAAAHAHREAAALYDLSLRHAADLEPASRAMLLQDYSRECNLTELSKEAIDAQAEAAQIWSQLEKPLKQGEALALLAIMLRNYGDNDAAEHTNSAAIRILEAQPPSKELALAYRVQATLCLSKRDNAEAIHWGSRAIELAGRFEDAINLAMAHIAVGSAWLFIDYARGSGYLQDRLEIALQANQDRVTANLLAYFGSCATELYQFDDAERYLAQGIAYTSERGLEIFTRYMSAWQALTDIHRGRWKQAQDTLERLLDNPTFPAVSRITALAAAGRLRVRMGAPGVAGVLDAAFEAARLTRTPQYLGLVCAVRAEAAWLAGDPSRAAAEASTAYDLVVNKRHAWFTGELSYWLWRAGAAPPLYAWMARPYALQIAGDWRMAAAEWEALGCPYEQARALAEGDREAQVGALKIFERLGAWSAAQAARQALQASGVAQLPRLPRRSTRQNPFGLTDRQVDILSLLVDGLTNAQISARLHISPKTADHHVSAILDRMDVHSREAAAALARAHPYFEK